MALVIERIPLFPLELVLYPGAALPLHIFEPRYREMVGRCLAENLEFGIACAFPGTGGSVARVGCTARIAAVLNRYDDGEFDILAYGVRRFRIRHGVEQRSYREADVEWLPEPEDDSTRADQARVTDLHNRLIMLAFEEGSAVDLRAPGDPEPGQFAFTLANLLPFDLGVKQAILESNSERHRLELLTLAYRSLIDRATAIVHEVESEPKHLM
jgi:uncharacterized protein